MTQVTLKGILFEVHECITCGIPYVVPQAVINHQRERGGYHCCHAGHRQGWEESQSERAKRLEEQARIRRERDRLQQQLAQKDDEIRETAKKLETVQKEAKRQKARARAGLCSCCNRHFTDLERHMASKHKGSDVAPHGGSRPVAAH